MGDLCAEFVSWKCSQMVLLMGSIRLVPSKELSPYTFFDPSHEIAADLLSA